MEELH